MDMDHFSFCCQLQPDFIVTELYGVNPVFFKGEGCGLGRTVGNLEKPFTRAPKNRDLILLIM